MRNVSYEGNRLVIVEPNEPVLPPYQNDGIRADAAHVDSAVFAAASRLSMRPTPTSTENSCS